MKRSATRGWALTTAAFAAVALAVGACSAPSPKEDAGEAPTNGEESPATGAVGEVELFLLDGDTSKGITAAAEDFTAEGSEGSVVVTALANDTYQQKIRTVMGSASRPDMFFNWGGATIKDYVDADLLLDLGPMIEAHPEIAANFQSAVLDAGKIDGRQFGIPFNGTQPVLLFYNQVLFDEAGLEPPQTWADVEGLIAEFNGRGITPFALAGSQAWCELEWFEYLLDRIGGPEVFTAVAAGDWSSWEDPAVLEAATMIRELVDAGAFGSNFASVGYGTGGSTSLMVDGKAAMTLQGTWEYPTAQGVDAEFAASNLAVVPFPAIEGGLGDPGNLVGNPANYVSVSANAVNTDTIAAFLQRLSTDDYLTGLMENNEVPTTKNAADFVESSPNPEFARRQIELVSDAPSFQLSWDLAIPADLAAPLLQTIQDLFNGALSPEDFVAAVLAIGN